jgi:hypothetical protein
MLDEFVSGRDRSKGHVAEIEGLLIREFRGTPLFEELTLPVASYEPSGGDYMYDATTLTRVFLDVIRTHNL